MHLQFPYSIPPLCLRWNAFSCSIFFTLLSPGLSKRTKVHTAHIDKTDDNNDEQLQKASVCAVFRNLCIATYMCYGYICLVGKAFATPLHTYDDVRIRCYCCWHCIPAFELQSSRTASVSEIKTPTPMPKRMESHFTDSMPFIIQIFSLRTPKSTEYNMHLLIALFACVP